MYPASETALEPGHDVQVTACTGRCRVQVAGPSCISRPPLASAAHLKPTGI